MIVVMPPANCTRVVLADYTGAGQAAIARLIASLPATALVAGVDDPDRVHATVRDTQADVLVIDDRLLRDVAWTAAELGVRLIVVGLHDDPGYPARAERLGAECWVAKDRADAVLPVLLPADAPVTRLC
jgi:hypothetical protein